jgi:hypothetical protein
MDMLEWEKFEQRTLISGLMPGSFSQFGCEWRMTENGYFATTSDYIQVTSKAIGAEYEEPDGVDWGEVIISLQSFKLSNLKGMPSAPKVAFDDCNLVSLEGIERCMAEQVSFIRCNANMNPVGLLRVLKARNVKRFVISDSFGLGANVANQLHKIMNRHLESRSIADCMDDLIEAGFKDFAKM